MKRLRATFRANPFLLEALGGIDKFNVGYYGVGRHAAVPGLEQ
jgi:hypothetical protein